MRLPLLLALPAVLLTPPTVAAQCTKVGSERWDVKTSAPNGSRTRHAFTAAELGALHEPPRIDEAGQKMLKTRYPDKLSLGLHEGDMVTVRGWVQLIKTSPDDCDYHIQLTPTKDGTTGTIIVEIPKADADHVSDYALRGELNAEHATILTQLKLAKEPGHVPIDGRAYMEFKGALFFDGPHYPYCDRRGEGTKAVTCWEVHPVVSTRFVRKPAA
ncbi:MAG: hypothetical protein ABJE47_24615 [bacterium]